MTRLLGERKNKSWFCIPPPRRVFDRTLGTREEELVKREMLLKPFFLFFCPLAKADGNILVLHSKKTKLYCGSVAY
ncbi:MAG: hypothetical protein HY959_05530 [Ignavibacteriae bacterium]|nr:hypothetical protein [Ignavibacteriota bacterium]